MQASVRPFRAVRVGDVELGDSDGMDLVGLLGHETLDGLAVVVIQNRRHGGGGKLSLSGCRNCDDRLLKLTPGPVFSIARSKQAQGRGLKWQPAVGIPARGVGDPTCGACRRAGDMQGVSAVGGKLPKRGCRSKINAGDSAGAQLREREGQLKLESRV